jgi:ElaB/YqjD/DUF883 family membrane-anchored ribosome-binding protein
MSGVEQTAESGAAGSEQSATEQAKERVQETAQQMGEKAQAVRGQAGDRFRQELDSRSSQAGEQVSTTADAIRRVGQQLREDGNQGVAKYADQVAERVERLGRYLSQSSADRVLHDAESFARRQPWLVALGAAAVGFLASRFVKASSANRYQQYDAASGNSTAALASLPTRDPGAVTSGRPGAAISSATGERSAGRGEL